MAEGAPQPIYARPRQPAQRFTYRFTDLTGHKLLALLPLRGVTFSRALNQAGSFSGTLPVEDPMLAQVDWQQATQVNKALVWVDLTGVLVWGGIVQGQNYDMKAQTVKVTATDFWGYMNQRLQAADYSTKFALPPGAGAMEISVTIITDALGLSYSLPVGVHVQGTTPKTYWVTFSAPLSMQESINSLVTELQQLGYLVGFDFVSNAAYVNGVPTGTLDLGYPRLGRLYSQTGLTVSTADATAFTYDVKGTAQADSVVEMATAAGAVSAPYVYTPAMSVYGYPRLEMLGMHTLFTSTTEPKAVMNAWGANDLMLNAFPIVTPKLTQDVFAQPTLGAWEMGDDMRVVVPKYADLPPNPRFPQGLDFHFRLIQATVKVADQGLSTVTYTFNMPPTTVPQPPPL